MPRIHNPRSLLEVAARASRGLMWRSRRTLEVVVAGLGSDALEEDPGERGAGDVAGAQGVGGDSLRRDPGGEAAFANDHADRVRRESGNVDAAVVDPSEQRPVAAPTVIEPGAEGGDRVGELAATMGDADDLAAVLWSILERRMVTRSPAERVSRSARSRPARSEQRSAPA